MPTEVDHGGASWQAVDLERCNIVQGCVESNRRLSVDSTLHPPFGRSIEIEEATADPQLVAVGGIGHLRDNAAGGR